MGAGPEHGVLSHALALSVNGVDVGEVDEVVEDEEGRDSGERKKERKRRTRKARERERGRARGTGRERNEEKKKRGERDGG